MAESGVEAAQAADVVYVDSDNAIIESACASCGENGTTTLLLTKIPHFRDVILMSFECAHCGYRDNELQDAAPLQDLGVRISARVLSSKGLNNQMVISRAASARIDTLDFEVEPTDQKGSITTVEGYLMRISQSLDDHIRSIAEVMMQQPSVSIELSTGELKSASDYIHKLTEIKDALSAYLSGDEEFTLILDDPSGNSYIEESEGISVNKEMYERTDEQQRKMGYAVKEDFKNKLDLTTPLEENEDVGKEGLSFVVDCPNCGNEGKNKICEVLVPGFGECVIMAFTCDFCGAKSNEIKPGGGYKDHGKKWTLDVLGVDDLNRDVIISETASVIIKHLDIEMLPGTIGAIFTTVEGLISKLAEGIEKSHPFMIGDSAPEMNQSLRKKVKELQKLADTEDFHAFTIVIDDPADHSFVARPLSLKGQDVNLIGEIYKRSFEQDEELGINDMKTENY
ncbi:zinc finger protein [Babesia gibsoni]|uniref:Zinc finger protein n=1 Tax=Babesia gibsoni TaxID=33632 RepID=A0AAD8LPV6_BABGI|nr:zinc finger protein [Babesia gibsoni]